jgi:hypothetical protein
MPRIDSVPSVHIRPAASCTACAVPAFAGTATSVRMRVKHCPRIMSPRTHYGPPLPNLYHMAIVRTITIPSGVPRPTLTLTSTSAPRTRAYPHAYVNVQRLCLCTHSQSIDVYARVSEYVCAGQPLRVLAVDVDVNVRVRPPPRLGSERVEGGRGTPSRFLKNLASIGIHVWSSRLLICSGVDTNAWMR